jgi:hypothetical protein
VLVFILKTKITAIAMNVLLHQLQEIVPTFNVASVPKDATGAYASPVHIIAGMLDKTPSYIQKIINGICVNVDANCTKMKVILNGTEQRNRIMVGDAESILRILASCNRPDMAAIVAKLHVVVPVSQAPSVAPTPQAPFVAEAPQVPVAPTPQAPSFAPAPQAPDDAMDVDGVSTNDLQNDDDITIQDHFDFVPAQMVEFVLELNGSKFNIPVRRDGYVNVTKICQAAGNGKRLDNYRASPAGKEYMDFLKKRNLAKSNTLNPGITLLTSIRGNCPSRGTFAHPDLAMAIAMWAHPPFLAEVTSWIQELLITGKVELGKEKTLEELDAIWKSRVAEEQAKIQADYLREKLSKELLAIDEDRASKRAREEEDKNDRVAKRQREDVAADVKAKEDSRMQLVRFDAEMAAKAIATTEDLKLKRLKVQDRQSNCAKSLIDLKANFMPKLTSCLELSLPTNAHLRSAINDIEVNLSRKINKLITGDDIESSGYQETQYCNDFQTFLREMGRPIATTSELSALGRFVSKKYQKANNDNKPEKIMKTVNGANCQVNTYKIEHKDFIEKCIKEFYEKSTIESTQPLLRNRAPKAPTNNISRYFR